jgi:trimeric autotransporter adhesin
VDHLGNLLISNTFSNRIEMVAGTAGTYYGQAMQAGHIYTVAGSGQGDSGDGGPATKADMFQPTGIGVDGAGNLLIADSYNGLIRVVAASTGTFYGQAMQTGYIYTVAGGNPGGGDNGVLATKAYLVWPDDVKVDSHGNLIIADADTGAVLVVAASTGTFYGQAMQAGYMYAVAGNGRQGYSGDGGPATSAEFNLAVDATVDQAGNLVIADSGNNRIRVVAASTGTFYGQAMQAGYIYTVAGNGTPGYSGDGGPATSAELNYSQGVAVDSAGNLLIADLGNSAIRVVAASTGTFYGQAMTAGDIYTIAGNGTCGLSGDGGPATSAELCSPSSVAPDGTGLVIADTNNNRVRLVSG